MIRYSISFDGGALFDAVGKVNATILPFMAQAVDQIAKYTAQEWALSVSAAKLRTAEKDAYMASIKIDRTGDFSRFVYSDYKYAEEIETGRPARDLKAMLKTSKKIRYVQNGKNAGKRFLIIPMRHNTPGNDALARDMPQRVHQQAQMLTLSRITGTQMQRNGGTGARVRSVQRNTYNWGSRLTAQSLKAAGASQFEQKRYAGMARFDTKTPGGGNHSSFLTFRVMGEWSSGWVVPAQPGQYLVRKVAQDMQPRASAAFALAATRTPKG